MNDIKKLHKVIDALEDQSSRVTEFNGVLSAVNSSREQIESAKSQLAKLSNEQKDLVSVSYKRFEEYSAILTKLESQVASFGETQNKTLEEIAALSFVTPEQHEQGRVATEKAVAEQLAALAGKVEQNRAETEKAVSEQLAALAGKVDEASASQQSTIKSLRTIVIFGLLVLAGSIAFLAKDAFMKLLQNGI